MFKMFGVTAEKPWVNVGDSLVHFMYDPPHLLKSVRNNLMKHRFEVNGQIVDSKYIADFFERDSKQLVKLAPRLTPKHYTSAFCCNRVRLAAQVLSHSVVAGIYTHVALNAMLETATYTAEFLEKLDGLFDCFNFGNMTNAKQFRRALTATSLHWSHLDVCKAMLSSLKVQNCKVKVPCIQGLSAVLIALFMFFKYYKHDMDSNSCSRIDRIRTASKIILP